MSLRTNWEQTARESIVPATVRDYTQENRLWLYGGRLPAVQQSYFTETGNDIPSGGESCGDIRAEDGTTKHYQSHLTTLMH